MNGWKGWKLKTKPSRFWFLWVLLGGDQFKEGKSVNRVLREKTRPGPAVRQRWLSERLRPQSTDSQTSGGEARSTKPGTEPHKAPSYLAPVPLCSAFPSLSPARSRRPAGRIPTSGPLPLPFSLLECSAMARVLSPVTCHHFFLVYFLLALTSA